MKWVAILMGAALISEAALPGQTPAPAPGAAPAGQSLQPAPAGQAKPSGASLSPRDASELETRMLQLMESTAVAVPGLVRASEPVKQNAEMTFATMERNPNPALLYQFINQVKAYLALSESIPRPYPFPETADRQFAELRIDLERIQQHFEAVLQVRQVTVTLPPEAQPRNVDPNNLGKYAQANSGMPPAGKTPRVVFMGDSITEAWHLNEYFTGRDFINRGIGGQVTSQMVGRFLQDVVALHPKAVVIMGGINDIGRGYTPNTIEANLEAMAELAKGHGIKPIFASLLPVSDYHKDKDPRYEMTKTHSPEEIAQVNRWLKEYCDREKFVYIDYYSVMADYKKQMPADLSDDGLHPNARGYRVMSPTALEAIGRVAAGAYVEESGDQQQPKRRVRMLGK
jgi:lysophospholipase L1-like esterase